MDITPLSAEPVNAREESSLTFNREATTDSGIGLFVPWWSIRSADFEQLFEALEASTGDDIFDLEC